MIRLSLVFFLSSASATQLETVYLNKLLQAKDSAVLRNIRQAYVSIHEDRRICEVQIATNAIPWVCYRLVDRESHWRLRTAGQTKSYLQSLDRHCRAAAKTLLDAPDDAFSIPKSTLSNDCLRQLKRTQIAARYRRGGE